MKKAIQKNNILRDEFYRSQDGRICVTDAKEIATHLREHKHATRITKREALTREGKKALVSALLYPSDDLIENAKRGTTEMCQREMAQQAVQAEFDRVKDFARTVLDLEKERIWTQKN